MKKCLIFLLLPFVIAGCSLYGKYKRPDFSDVPVTDSLPSIHWRKMYTDTLLQKLIDTALVKNTDFRVALMKVQEAEAGLTQTKLGYLPSLSLEPSATAEWSVTLPVKASWEIDVFGKQTNIMRGAGALLYEKQAYAQAVRSSLISAVAETYYTLLLLDRELLISEQTLVSWEKSIRVQESLKAAGKEKDIAVQRSIAKKLDLEASAMTIKQNIKDTELSLCSLMGVPKRSIERGQLSNMDFADLKDVPVCNLGSRPDVRQAEMRLAQAFYATNKARSDFYPSLTLGGSAGWLMNNGMPVLDASSFIWNALASLTQPLFSRGNLSASLKKAKLQQEEAKLHFRQSLLDAGNEINSALVKCETASAKLRIHSAQTQALQNAVDKIELLMVYSATNYLEVLTAQQSLLDAQILLAKDQFDKIQGAITLYRAIGGGVE